jgi:transketolase
MALGAKKMAKDFTVYCMVGDGETQEGQVWEAAEIAYRYQLDNLIVLMDYNKLQQYGWKGKDQPRDIPVVNPAKKWEAFGWNVLEINGHDYQEIVRACQDAKKQKGKPTVIVAHTIKGKGVSFMQNQYLWHSKVPTDEELAKAFAEIDGEVNINV